MSPISAAAMRRKVVTNARTGVARRQNLRERVHAASMADFPRITAAATTTGASLLVGGQDSPQQTPASERRCDLCRLFGGLGPRHARRIQHQERREAEPEEVVPPGRGALGGEEPPYPEEHQREWDE